MEAIAAYTVEGAYAQFMEHRKGRLKCGYLADIVVLSRDIEEIQADVLHEVVPVMTICGGRTSYRGGGWSAGESAEKILKPIIG